jgi:hypothetical protein
MVPMPRPEFEASLNQLLGEGKIRSIDRETPAAKYLAQGCYIPVGDPAGWEAAVFDHYQALVTAVCAKLRMGANATDRIGGSTYAYFVWPGHPMENEVYGFLARLREQAVALRQRLDEFNRTQEKSREEMTRVTTYVGQSVSEPEREVDT